MKLKYRYPLWHTLFMELLCGTFGHKWDKPQWLVRPSLKTKSCMRCRVSCDVPS